VDIRKNSFIRYFWLFIGLILTLIGLIGVIVPGLPTTPIMILAAACFFRSSEKLYNWVISNKYFGHYVKNYREHGAMPKKAKIYAFIFIWSFVSFSVFIGISSELLWAKIMTLIGAIIGTIYIAYIPNIEHVESIDN